MKRITAAALLSFVFAANLQAQEETEKEEKKGFQKEKLFTGGSVSLSFGNNVFLIGGSPVFGYNLTKWADAGIVANYNYTSYRDFNNVFNDKLHQSVYGGGVFTRLFPVRFLFAQAQFEHNFIKLKFIPANGNPPTKDGTSANSMLVGGGYTTNRYPDQGGPFYYVALLFDVSGNKNSPYTDGYGRVIPILRAGLQIPLFQGRGGTRE
jgi:hypothetical protein